MPAAAAGHGQHWSRPSAGLAGSPALSGRPKKQATAGLLRTAGLQAESHPPRHRWDKALRTCNRKRYVRRKPASLSQLITANGPHKLLEPGTRAEPGRAQQVPARLHSPGSGTAGSVACARSSRSCGMGARAESASRGSERQGSACSCVWCQLSQTQHNLEAIFGLQGRSCKPTRQP